MQGKHSQLILLCVAEEGTVSLFCCAGHGQLLIAKADMTSEVQFV